MRQERGNDKKIKKIKRVKSHEVMTLKEAATEGQLLGAKENNWERQTVNDQRRKLLIMKKAEKKNKRDRAMEMRTKHGRNTM